MIIKIKNRGHSMKALTIILTLLATAVTSGCASITRGTKDVFSVQTTPPGATATMSNGLTCVTPCTLELPRKHGFSVTLELDGYKGLTTNIVPKQAGAGSAGMAGNIIFGGLIGAAVDAGSGAMKDLYPNPLIVTLVRETSDEGSTVDLPVEEIKATEVEAQGGTEAPNPDEANGMNLADGSRQ